MSDHRQQRQQSLVSGSGSKVLRHTPHIDSGPASEIAATTVWGS